MNLLIASHPCSNVSVVACFDGETVIVDPYPFINPNCKVSEVICSLRIRSPAYLLSPFAFRLKSDVSLSTLQYNVDEKIPPEMSFTITGKHLQDVPKKCPMCELE